MSHNAKPLFPITPEAGCQIERREPVNFFDAYLCPTTTPTRSSLDMDAAYERYLVTCRMSGVTPVPRERAEGPIQEWIEVLTGRPEPTTH